MRNRLFFCMAIGISALPVLLNAQNGTLPDGPGKDVTQKICGACHGVEIVIGRQETQEGWSAIVNEMIQRGASGTDDEFSAIVDYLAKNFSKPSGVAKINVNKATAKDLETALGITETQAAGIVHWRTEKGDFKSIEELEKVPGLETAKIEANKNRLAF